MAKYTNTYLLADKHLQDHGMGTLYSFLMKEYRDGRTYGEVVLDLHDLGHNVSDETIRNWYRLLIPRVADLRVGEVA